MLGHSSRRGWSAPPAEVFDPDFVVRIQTTTPDEVFSWNFVAGGIYDATIDYGDGSPIQTITSDTDPNLTHTYAVADVYTVRMSGSLGGLRLRDFPEVNKVLIVESLGDKVFNGNCDYMFYQSTSLQEVWAGDLSAVTAARFGFNLCSALTSVKLQAIGTDVNQFLDSCDVLETVEIDEVSQVTNLRFFARRCPLLRSLKFHSAIGNASCESLCRETSLLEFVSGDLSAGTNFEGAFRQTALVDFPPNMFDTCLATNFTNAFFSAALNQQSVDDILVSIDTAGQSSGTLGIHGGSNAAPSAVGLAAKASLEGKGWTVQTN